MAATPPEPPSTIAAASLLAEHWGVVTSRVTGALSKQGFDDTTAEDAVAEAVARSLASDERFDDVDHLCAWAFRVARNMARDSRRKSSRLSLLDEIPDEPDAYDLVRHVEARDCLSRVGRALHELSSADQRSVVAGVQELERSTTRTEAVRLAVRRHRARARLKKLLERFAGIISAAKWERLAALSCYDRVAAVVIASVLALGSGVVPPHDMPVPAQWPGKVAAPPAAGIRSARPQQAGPALPVGQTRHVVRQAAGVAASVVIPRGVGFEFTPSPAYADDGTVFATVLQRPEDCAAGPCSWLFRSIDRGATWQPLGRRAQTGTLLVPPSYPRDPRLFASGQMLSVSHDGGRTFDAIGPATGPATMSPDFSNGDPTIIIGSNAYAPLPTSFRYVDGEPTLKPFKVPLAGAIALRFWHIDRARVLVLALRIVDNDEPLSRRTGQYALYSCSAAACDEVANLGLEPFVGITRVDATTVIAATGRSTFRSTDGGRSFSRTPVPPGAMTTDITSHGSRVYALSLDGPSTTLFASDDVGDTWREIQRGLPLIEELTSLPDGTLIGSRNDQRAMTCSTDGGLTWNSTCVRS
jgi:RNA polymerase sigma factor (sigma-70 family)